MDENASYKSSTFLYHSDHYMGVDLMSGYHFFILLPPIGLQAELSILARLDYYCYLINLIS